MILGDGVKPLQSGTVLIVDDEPNALKVLSAILTNEGYAVLQSNSVDASIEMMQAHDIDVVVTDIRMPGKDGLTLFEHIQKHSPDIPVIFLTAYGTVEAAVDAMTHKAFYYFIKPPDYTKLKGIIARAAEQRSLKREIGLLKERLFTEDKRTGLIGRTPEMLRILDIVNAIKDSVSSVLICGETGTGKEVIARQLHNYSSRKNHSFVAVNCAAIPRELMESELFGYEKGAFTGAIGRRIGKFEEANGGTILLDEIGELDLSLQAKLLRIIQERELVRIGSNRSIPINFRLISSTNRDLKKDVENGNFREDLFYRINVVRIDVPPLRERRDDIPLLVAEFIKEFCAAENKLLNLSEGIMDIFSAYSWPGNIRQLRNVMERAVVLARGSSITLRDLPEEIITHLQPLESAKVRPLKEVESQVVIDALKECRGNKSKAARLLGISRKAFYRILSEMEMINHS
jgi:two-component system response regulator HydG